jgi:hypothetical protein
MAMRYTTNVCSGAFVLGLAGLWSTSAHAIPSCGSCEYVPEECTTIPARYTAGTNGDVAVNTLSENPSIFQQTVDDLLKQLNPLGGPIYIHTKALNNSSGYTFAETFPSSTPPLSYTTGEPHACSRPLSPYYLQRLSPGAGTYVEDAQPGVLVKAFAQVNCAPPAESYRINSFISPNDSNMLGGSCEKELVDYCHVPVDANLDRTPFAQKDAVNALTAAWNAGYDYCMGIIGSSITEILASLGIEGVGCGGSPESVTCDRVGWQIVNELLFKAYPVGYINPSNPLYGYEAGLLSPDGVDHYEDGWSDFDVGGAPPNPNGPFPPANYNTWSGTVLGAAKVNYQSEPTQETMCPGQCNTTGCNGPPIPCSPWVPTSWKGNLPINVLNAAARQGKTVANGGIVNVSVNSGITPGSTTCVNAHCQCN